MVELLYKIKRLEHIKLAIALIVLSILDVILTQMIISKGGVELNPIMQYPVNHSMALTWSIKLIGVIAVSIVLLWCATMRPRPVKITFIGLIGLMSFVCLHNGIVLLINL